MRLFKVALPVDEYSATSPGDRARATIKLLQALMKRPGYSAHWLYLAPELPCSPELSTLPVMSETSVSGRAKVRIQGALVNALGALPQVWEVEGAPVGSVDDSGYFIFWARAALVVHAPGIRQKSPESSCRRLATDKAYNDRCIWAIEIGRRRELNRDPMTNELHNVQLGVAKDPFTELVLMFAENHGHELHHRVGTERHIDERRTTAWDWKWRQFRVGGSGRGNRVRFGISAVGPVDMSDGQYGPDVSRFYNQQRDIYIP